jgi:hypothetical protein
MAKRSSLIPVVALVTRLFQALAQQVLFLQPVEALLHRLQRRREFRRRAGLSDHCWTLRELLTFNAAITSKIA